MNLFRFQVLLQVIPVRTLLQTVINKVSGESHSINDRRLPEGAHPGLCLEMTEKDMSQGVIVSIPPPTFGAPRSLDFSPERVRALRCLLRARFPRDDLSLSSPPSRPGRGALDSDGHVRRSEGRV